jgi:hypothetical protein
MQSMNFEQVLFKSFKNQCLENVSCRRKWAAENLRVNGGSNAFASITIDSLLKSE